MQYASQCNVNINTRRGSFSPHLILLCQTSSGNLEGQEKPEDQVTDLQKQPKKPEKVVDDLDPTEDGEASEKTHCASY